MRLRLLAGLLAATVAVFGQLTPEQRVEDFRRLAGLFAYQYAPYEWKRDRFQADLYDVTPWLERVRKAPSDLEAIEVMSEYVASLRDTHAQFRMAANFYVNLPLQADIVDGDKVVVDSIVRSALPADRYPIQIGDELVSADGRSAQDWVAHNARFIGQANERARRRLAAAYITFRPQSIFPRAFEVGENAVLVIRHRATGATATYEIPWVKFGTPILRPGPVISPFLDQTSRRRAGNAEAETNEPEETGFFARYHNRGVDTSSLRLTGYGNRAPYFVLPAGFQQRLGRVASDFYFSGTYEAGGKRIGYLRIPSFQPPSTQAALQQLAAEIPFLQQNTDGLVVDVSRNTGGGCVGAEILRWLIPYRFDLPSDEIRASLSNLVAAQSQLVFYRNISADTWRIQLTEQIVKALESAYRENRGRTGPVPFCAETNSFDPATDSAGRILAYTKPVLVLTDEFTTSWGDTFAVTMQDNRRGPIFGYRTNGAGGSVSADWAGFFSETQSSFSLTLGTRSREVVTEDYGTTNVLENVGVRPDIPFDYMTLDNLRQSGLLFTTAFTEAIVAEIDKAAR